MCRGTNVNIDIQLQKKETEALALLNDKIGFRGNDEMDNNRLLHHRDIIHLLKYFQLQKETHH